MLLRKVKMMLKETPNQLCKNNSIGLSALVMTFTSNCPSVVCGGVTPLERFDRTDKG